jgi:hypothetical protein
MMAFLILHIALSGRFSFGSRHGLRPSAPRAAHLALIAFRYGDFLPARCKRHSAGNESPASITCAQFRLIHISDPTSQFHTSTPHIPLIGEWSSPRSLPDNLKEVYIVWIGSILNHQVHAVYPSSLLFLCPTRSRLAVLLFRINLTWAEACMSNTAKGRLHVAGPLRMQHLM